MSAIQVGRLALLQVSILAFTKLEPYNCVAVREEQRGCSRRATWSFAKSNVVVRERQIKKTSKKGETKVVDMKKGYGVKGER